MPVDPAAPLVLVVAYGKPDLLAKCLAGVAGLSVLVVDNSLSDEVEAVCADVRYLRAPRNLGFGAGVNLGLAHGWDGSSDVLLLNPDAVLSAAGVRTVQAALHAGPRVGMASPLLAGPDGPQRAAWPLPSPRQIWLDALGLGARSARDVFLTGAVLMLRGDALADVGPFDERYFLYVEETDWQKRALLRGWTPVVVDAVTARHVGGATGTSENTLRWSQASGEIYLRKWFGNSGWQVARAGSAFARSRRRLQRRGTA